MTALWIAHISVHDEEAYGRYVKEATACVAAHGGAFIARGGKYRQMEGPDRPRNVVARFPTFDDAVACYENPRYQDALKIALAAADRELVIVEEA